MATDRCSEGCMTIDMVPDDALLEIFTCLRGISQFNLWWWIPLVHTCRRWRHVIFASPFHLRVVLVCDSRTPVRKTLEIWPPFPICVHYLPTGSKDENAVAALEHRDRVSDVFLYLESIPEYERFATRMQEPFPALTSLVLASNMSPELVLPETFLGGSAPSLKIVFIQKIAFPALPRLLLSAPRLVDLALCEIPVGGNISSEAMATCLATLTNLECLRIEFQSTHPHPNHTSPPSFPRTVLPFLTLFCFKGISEYLEDLVSRIDAPILKILSITFEGSIFHTPQLCQFVNRAERFKLPNRAELEFNFPSVSLKLKPSDSFELDVRCDKLIEGGWAMEVVCQELSPLLSRVDCLDVYGGANHAWPHWRDAMGTTGWLGLFRPFITVQTLRVSWALWAFVVYALKELTGERTTEVLPELRTLFFSGFRPADLEPFIAARQLSGHPVALHPWENPGHDGQDREG